MKTKLSHVVAERNQLKADAETAMKEIDLLKTKLSSSLIEEDSKEGNQVLQEKYVTLEKKVRKYIAHCEHLEKTCNVLKEENKIIPQMKHELKEVNIELERKNLELEKAQFANSQSDRLDGALKKNHEKLEEELSLIKNKYAKQKELNKALKQSSDELEYEKNRQISYLENENLQYLGELKATKKELKSLKVQRHMFSSGVDDAPTEDLGSIVSAKLKESSKLGESDKENNPNQSFVHKSKKQITPSRVGLGAGVGNSEDSPGECKQS